jgi:hypothetical protein
MIESVEDLGLDDLDHHEEGFWEKVDQSLKEHLDLSLEILKQKVCDSIKERAEETALDLPNIAPYGDYGAMMEDNDSMAQFLKNEASKAENWMLYSIQPDQTNKSLIKFILKCKAVDDGDVLQGLVFTNKSGVIRHTFCRVDI